MAPPSDDSRRNLLAAEADVASQSQAYDPEKHERPATMSSSSSDSGDHSSSAAVTATRTQSRGRSGLANSLARVGSAASRNSRLSRTVSEVRDGIQNQRDLELGGDSEEEAAEKEAARQRSADPNLVSWDGPDDPESPKNWQLKKKWAAVVCGTSSAKVLPFMIKRS